MGKLEIKKLTNYDLKRVITRVGQEFGKIQRGTEEKYNPQLHYLEKRIYEVYQMIKITDYELQEVISAVIYDTKSYIDNKKYDYSSILTKDQIRFANNISYIFNPFINEEIKVQDYIKNNLKELFTLPIICLARIYDSIDFWRNYYGKNGYYKMLDEYVAPIQMIGEIPYALEEIYLKDE